MIMSEKTKEYVVKRARNLCEICGKNPPTVFQSRLSVNEIPFSDKYILYICDSCKSFLDAPFNRKAAVERGWIFTAKSPAYVVRRGQKFVLYEKGKAFPYLIQSDRRKAC